MATETLLDYANVTVKMPGLMRKMDDQLNEKQWEAADKTCKELIQLNEQLGNWLGQKIAQPKP